MGRFFPFHRGHRALLAFAALVSGGMSAVIVREHPGDKELNKQLGGFHPSSYQGLCRLPLGEETTDNSLLTIRNALRLHSVREVLLFSLEPIDALAEALGARVVPFEPGLGVEPAAIEADPIAHWGLLTDEARWQLLRRVAVVGNDPSARAALVRRLAGHYKATATVGPLDLLGLRPDSAATPAQIAEACALALGARSGASGHDAHLVFSNDDPRTVIFLSERLFGAYPTWAKGLTEPAPKPVSLHLVLEDRPVEDPTLPLARTEKALKSASEPHEILRGTADEQFDQALVAVDRLLAARQKLFSPGA